MLVSGDELEFEFEGESGPNEGSCASVISSLSLVAFPYFFRKK